MRDELQLPEESLYPFLARRVGLYTGLDHSSVPKNLALELLESVRFTLQQGEGVPIENLEARFAAGQAAIAEKMVCGKKRWQAACGSLPRIENRSLWDTLECMEGFWRRYDKRFFAHQIPCDIDYQLCHPVEEELLGIDYVNAYLDCLLTENEFLNYFNPRCAAALLECCYRDYKGLLINLYEPVAVNALGLTMVGGDFSQLHISAAQREELRAKLGRRGEEQLNGAAEKLSALMGLEEGGSAYLRATAHDLLPRVRSANLEGIFLSWT